MRIRFWLPLPGPFALTSEPGRTWRRPKARAIVVGIFLAVLAVEAFRHFVLGSW